MARKSAQRPGPVTVTSGTGPVPASAQLAAVVNALAPSTPPVAAPAAPAAPTIALRGGLAIQAVALTGKAYRVTAPHNVAWWQSVQAAITAGGGQATVQALVENSKVPATNVGYLVRRGYLKAVTPPAAETAPAA